MEQQMIVVIGTRSAERAYRYTALIHALGHQALAARESAPLLGCIIHPMSGLLLLEDGFIQGTSAHNLIQHIRNAPGHQSSIPIVRIWNGPVLADGPGNDSVVTISAPVTGATLEKAMLSLGLERGT
jgi:hypothetical protein